MRINNDSQKYKYPAYLIFDMTVSGICGGILIVIGVLFMLTLIGFTPGLIFVIVGILLLILGKTTEAGAHLNQLISKKVEEALPESIVSEKVKVLCPSCNAKNEETDKFCSSCGTSLKPEEKPTNSQ